MNCYVPDCEAEGVYQSPDGLAYCAPHAGIPPLCDTQEHAHWRYDPDDGGLYLWAPYGALNGPDDPPGRLWPVLKLTLGTGQVLIVGHNVYRVGAMVWEAVKAQAPADLTAQLSALDGQIRVAQARYGELAKAVAALEARAEALATDPAQRQNGGLWLPGRQN